MRTFLLLISLAVFGSASAQNTEMYTADVNGETYTLYINSLPGCSYCTNWAFHIYVQSTDMMLSWNGYGEDCMVFTPFDYDLGGSGYDLFDEKGKKVMHIVHNLGLGYSIKDGADTIVLKRYKK